MTSPPDEYILQARSLEKSFGKGRARVDVLRGLDLSVRRGKFLAVMGPSGCGKSTLLHVLGLITPPDGGELLLSGSPAPNSEHERARLRRTEIGFIFQRFNLIASLSATDNVRISLKVRGCNDTGLADRLMQQMGVAHVADRKPAEMSIGEQQRVAAVRALAHSPAILLADEPTGNLDSTNAESLLALLREINRQTGQTIVMITHSREAAGVADTVLRMRDGVICQPAGAEA
jgi:putative ABC transport system ATP-binding protein